MSVRDHFSGHVAGYARHRPHCLPVAEQQPLEFRIEIVWRLRDFTSSPARLVGDAALHG